MHARAATLHGTLWYPAERSSWLFEGVVVLNLLDAVFTLFWVQTGIAVEANVLLSDLVETEALRFMITKVGLVSLAVLLLWRLRTEPMAMRAMGLAFVTYACVFAWHLCIAAMSLAHFA